MIGFAAQRDAALVGKGFNALTGDTVRHDSGRKRWAYGVFGSYVEVAYPATHRVNTPIYIEQKLGTLVSTAPEVEEKDKLAEFGAALFLSHIGDRRVSILGLLERFKTTKISISVFIDMLPPLRVRTY
jgi:cytochrome P450/NADPH-cytochrome P450 reductase